MGFCSWAELTVVSISVRIVTLKISIDFIIRGSILIIRFKKRAINKSFFKL
jgi:hypothetical protein